MSSNFYPQDAEFLNLTPVSMEDTYADTSSFKEKSLEEAKNYFDSIDTTEKHFKTWSEEDLKELYIKRPKENIIGISFIVEDVNDSEDALKIFNLIKDFVEHGPKYEYIDPVEQKKKTITFGQECILFRSNKDHFKMNGFSIPDLYENKNLASTATKFDVCRGLYICNFRGLEPDIEVPTCKELVDDLMAIIRDSKDEVGLLKVNKKVLK